MEGFYDIKGQETKGNLLLRRIVQSDTDNQYLSQKLKVSKNSLIEILNQESLVEKNKTINALKVSKPSLETSGVIFGTGLSNSLSLTQKVPFDTINYFLLSQKIRNKLGLKATFHVIADIHSTLNGFDPIKINTAASKFKSVTERVVKNLNIANYTIHKSSELLKDKKYIKILQSVDHSDANLSDYGILEATDIEYFRATRGVSIKLGWSMPGAQLDEFAFDNFYKTSFGSAIYTFYTQPGKRLSQYPNTVPYTVSKTQENERILLDQSEDVEKKISESGLSKNQLNHLKKYYKSVIRLFKDVTGNDLPKTQNVWVKLNYIIQEVLK